MLIIYLVAFVVAPLLATAQTAQGKVELFFFYQKRNF